jgi:NAD(P) transhydrogenase subunit beta
MGLNLVILLYLVASVCFIQALKGLSHPTTSRAGNVFGGFLVTRRMLDMFKKKEPKAGTGKGGAA